MFWVQPVHALECDLLEPWLTQGHPSLPKAATYADRVASAHKEFELREDTAEALRSLYIAGKLDSRQLDACLAGLPFRQNFLNSLYSHLYIGSFKKA